MAENREKQMNADRQRETASAAPQAGGPAMSFWGVGPKIGGSVALYFGVAVLVDWLTGPMFRIQVLSPEFAMLFAGVLLAIGVSCYLYTLLHLRRAWKVGRLVTTGPYRMVRHPLYAIGLFFFCPAACLPFRSILVMTTPFAMGVVTILLLHQEEERLLEVFGDAYRQYRRATAALVPRLTREDV